MERGTKSATLADLLPLSAKLYGEAPAICFKQDGEWVKRSFDDVQETVRALSLGLIDLGVAKGDKVSILANTRPEWTYFDFAALSTGATVVPIFHGRIDKSLFQSSLRSISPQPQARTRTSGL